ncbi:MAG: polyprenyl synthetase family protein [Planctomycetota bacterium]
MDVTTRLARAQARVERSLARWVRPSRAAHGRIYEAMRYSVFAGGKRIRPVLALAVCRMLGGRAAEAMAGGCAIELVHTYSLIHDDLPCMDNDDFRRGKPTSHKVFGESIALLAGDGLQALAFDLIAARVADPERSRRMIAALARAAGPDGMVGGQLLDLAYEGRRVPLERILDLHARKTGAMFLAAVRMGVIAGGAGAAARRALDRYGRELGLLFQIVDDILDETGDLATLGKTAGKDKAAGKSTFPALLGLDGARAWRDRVHARARRALAPFGRRADELLGITAFIAGRDR